MIVNNLTIFKVSNPEILTSSRFEIWKNGSYYTSNISRSLKDRYVKKFIDQGYQILTGRTIKEHEERNE